MLTLTRARLRQLGSQNRSVLVRMDVNAFKRIWMGTGGRGKGARPGKSAHYHVGLLSRRIEA